MYIFFRYNTTGNVYIFSGIIQVNYPTNLRMIGLLLTPQSLSVHLRTLARHEEVRNLIPYSERHEGHDEDQTLHVGVCL